MDVRTGSKELEFVGSLLKVKLTENNYFSKFCAVMHFIPPRWRCVIRLSTFKSIKFSNNAIAEQFHWLAYSKRISDSRGLNDSPTQLDNQ